MSSLTKSEAHDWAVHITKSLLGTWFGSYGSCRCPAHDDRKPSLSVRGGDTTVLVTCHAGCDGRDVVRSLDDRGLWPKSNKPFSPPAVSQRCGTPKRKSSDAAKWLWEKSLPLKGTLAERYLRSRRFETLECPDLRFLPDSLHGPTQQKFPCLVAAVRDVSGKLHGIHRTHLDPKSAQKAPIDDCRLWLGNCRGHAVQLAPATQGVLGLAEGLETADSAMAMFGIPVWAALSTRNLDQVTLPENISTVIVFADNGTPGHEAAHRAKNVYEAQGLSCHIEYPRKDCGDFNDVVSMR